MEKGIIEKRMSGLDLVRVLATIFVVAVHFFMNSGFYNIRFVGKRMFVATFFRWLFYICCPLFMILTGYLNSNKKIEKKFYRKIIPILLSYLFICIVALIFRMTFLDEKIKLFSAIIKIFSFEAVGYAWYVEMYIGLFLLIPFLNILYGALKDKKTKLILIVTLLLINSLPPLCNVISINNIKLNIFPDWWVNLYPLVYYYIGCFIKEYKPLKNKKILLGTILVVLLLIETSLSYVFSHIYSSNFSRGFLGGYNCIFTIAISVTFFLLFYDIDINSKIANKCLSNISRLSLEIYLFSYIADKIVYKYFNTFVSKPIEYLRYSLIVVLLSFSIALILSIIKDLIFKIISFTINKINNTKQVNTH